MAMVDKTVQVNLRGYFELSALAAQQMKTDGGGVIVNIASINGLKPGLGQGIYSITKAAVINMTQTFAKECASWKVRVNAVLPGQIGKHTSELQSLMRISYAVFCLKKK